MFCLEELEIDGVTMPVITLEDRYIHLSVIEGLMHLAEHDNDAFHALIDLLNVLLERTPMLGIEA